jgi:hypothetical protein
MQHHGEPHLATQQLLTCTAMCLPNLPEGGAPICGGPRRGKSWPVPPREGPPDAPAGAADQGALVGARVTGDDSPLPSAFDGAGCPAAPLPGAACCAVAGRAFPPEPQEPPGTSCRLGSKPLFSAFLLGKLMGFGTAMMGPALRTPPPRTADESDNRVSSQHLNIYQKRLNMRVDDIDIKIIIWTVRVLL